VSELKGTTKPFTGLQQAVNKNMIASLAVSHGGRRGLRVGV
jgi:hypothetical protein